MEQWFSEHHAFVIKTYFKSGEMSIIVTQRLRKHFHLGSKGQIPVAKLISFKFIFAFKQISRF